MEYAKALRRKTPDDERLRLSKRRIGLNLKECLSFEECGGFVRNETEAK